MRACTPVLLLIANLTLGQTAQTLERAGSRNPDGSAALDGQTITVRGQVSSAPIGAVGISYLPLRDEAGYGLVLAAEAPDFAGLSRGEWIVATGVLSSRAGLPVLKPSRIDRDQAPGSVRPAEGPGPQDRTLLELAGPRYVGLLVSTEGVVDFVGANSGGRILRIRNNGVEGTIFLPRSAETAGSELTQVGTGDRVRAAGLATQYSAGPSYDRRFQLILASAADLAIVASATPRTVWIAPAGFGAIAVLLGLWWLRERRARVQRRSVHAFHKLSENIISAASPKEIAEKISHELPGITSATTANLYLFNRQSRSLERVPTEAEPEPMAVPVDGTAEGLANACVICFRNRAALNVPDVRRNPLVQAGWKTGLPRSAMFAPLVSGQEVSGVLEIQNAQRVGYFRPEEQAAIQHLANQVAAALKLQDQQAVREQLFRGEKLAATGRLISGIAHELREPLETIANLAESLASFAGRPTPERDLGLLEREARRASEIVGRLVSFAGQENVAPQPVDVNALVASLARFREHEWRALGLRVQNKLNPLPALVAGVRGQLEQVFLNLMVHAEQRAAEASPRTIGIQSSVMAGHAMVEISFSLAPEDSAGKGAESGDPFREGPSADAGAMSLSVCRGIVQGHGGELRRHVRSGYARFEVDLPLAEGAPSTPVQQHGKPLRPLTLMLVEVDPDTKRILLASLSSRGHRAVPVALEEAAEVAGRLRFDAVLWAVRSRGGRWSEFRERTRMSAFVLLSDGYDRELARSLEESGGFLLALPIDDGQLDRILREIANRNLLTARRA